ncbi:MAG: DNA repair protein RecO [Patescibacteria group bacterium]|jgi:DNA repair protein RecO (recombination protein O)
MSRTTNTAAIILRNDPLNGADARLSFFTASHGKIDAIARGLQKPTSKLAAHLEPITLVELFFIDGRTRRLVGGSVVENRFSVIRSDIRRLFAAGLIVRIAELMAPYENTDEQFFSFLLSALGILDDQTCREATLRITPHFFAWKLMALSGYRPTLTHCAVCSRHARSEAVILFPRRGVVIHENCRATSGSESGIVLLPAALKGLHYMAQAPLEDALRLNTTPSVFSNIAGAIEALMEERFDIAAGGAFWQTAV